MSRRAAGLTLALTTLALTTPAFADELPFDCASLEAVVTQAPTRFDQINHAVVKQFGVDAEIPMAAEAVEQGSGDGADANLHRRPVGDALGH